MNTPDGNNLPPIGFMKMGFLVLYTMIASFVIDYSVTQLSLALVAIHLLTFGSLLGLNKLFPNWFNKSFKEILIGVFSPLYTLSFLAGFKP